MPAGVPRGTLEGDVVAAPERQLGGRGQAFGHSHGPTGDGKGCGSVDAQAVAASELHGADQRCIGGIDAHHAHAAPHAGALQRRVELAVRERGQHAGVAPALAGLQLRLPLREVEALRHDGNPELGRDLRHVRSVLPSGDTSVAATWSAFRSTPSAPLRKLRTEASPNSRASMTNWRQDSPSRWKRNDRDRPSSTAWRSTSAPYGNATPCRVMLEISYLPLRCSTSWHAAWRYSRRRRQRASPLLRSSRRRQRNPRRRPEDFRLQPVET